MAARQVGQPARVLHTARATALPRARRPRRRLRLSHVARSSGTSVRDGHRGAPSGQLRRQLPHRLHSERSRRRLRPPVVALARRAVLPPVAARASSPPPPEGFALTSPARAARGDRRREPPAARGRCRGRRPPPHLVSSGHPQRRDRLRVRGGTRVEVPPASHSGDKVGLGARWSRLLGGVHRLRPAPGRARSPPRCRSLRSPALSESSC